MKTLVLAAALAFAAAPAFAAPVTFQDTAGNTWTVVEGGNGAGISALHMTADAARACPSLTIKLESVPVGTGPKMTSAQKFRGDTRWHIVCVLAK